MYILWICPAVCIEEYIFEYQSKVWLKQNDLPFGSVLEIIPTFLHQSPGAFRILKTINTSISFYKKLGLRFAYINLNVKESDRTPISSESESE